MNFSLAALPPIIKRARPVTIPTAPPDRASAIALLRTLHEETAQHFNRATTRLVEISTDELAGTSASGARLLENCHRMELIDELTRFREFCEEQFVREEGVLRAAGIRHFPRAWSEHKRSHRRLQRSVLRCLREGDGESPGTVARQVAAVIEGFWASHSLDHDQLAFSLLALLDRAHGPFCEALRPRTATAPADRGAARARAA